MKEVEKKVDENGKILQILFVQEDIKMTEQEKESTTYFMVSMRQKEFEEIYKCESRRNDFETGWSKNDKYIFNKIMSDCINKIGEDD